MNHPADLKYASTHEWVRIEGDLVVTGISDHAQDALGDLVYVEAPEVGQHVTAGDQAGVVESVKTASDIHAPVSGEVVEVNSNLEDDPDFVTTLQMLKNYFLALNTKLVYKISVTRNGYIIEKSALGLIFLFTQS
jgi:glycine cleavage system H protein